MSCRRRSGRAGRRRAARGVSGQEDKAGRSEGRRPSSRRAPCNPESNSPALRDCVPGSLSSTWSAHLDVVRNLFENDPLALQSRRTEPAPFAVNHFHPGMVREPFKNFTRQHVPTLRALIAQNAVEQEIDALALVNSQERAPGNLLWNRRPGLREKYVRREFGILDALADVAPFVEQRLPEGAKPETAAKPLHCLSLSIPVALAYALQSFGGYIYGYVFLHFNKNKAPSLTVCSIEL